MSKLVSGSAPCEALQQKLGSNSEVRVLYGTEHKDGTQGLQ